VPELFPQEVYTRGGVERLLHDTKARAKAPRCFDLEDHPMKRLAIACTALTLATATACGGLPDHEGGQSTLVTLHGSVQSQSGALGGAGVHVAVIWENGQAHALAVDVPVKAEFPAAFSIPLKSAPPAGFIVPTKDIGGAEVAIGGFVAYQDLNKNGKLDLLDESSTKAIDHVVGIDKTHQLVFIKSAPNGFDKMKDENGVVPRLGFNILTPDEKTNGFVWDPISTGLLLTEDDSPEAQMYMCANGMTESGGGAGKVAPAGTIGPNGAYPAPDDPNLQCDPTNPDQYIYNEQTLVVDKPCDKQYTLVETVYSKQPGTSPTGWPCP
jgi:hypothetical protein